MLRKILRRTALAALLVIVAPILVGAALSFARGWPESWRSASWASSGLLPAAATVAPARVVVIAARTGNWKSIFAEHMSIVLKPEGAKDWIRFDVVGWGHPVRRNAYPADAHWYGNRPYIVTDIAGPEAEALIPAIEAAIAAYPYRQRGAYTVWPGPNSNSFVAWVVRNTPGFAAELPPVAIGKDYLGPGAGLARAASGTGVVLSIGGLVGVTVALEEGLEVNLFGTGIGIDPLDLAIALPALGKLSLFDLAG